MKTGKIISLGIVASYVAAAIYEDQLGKFYDLIYFIATLMAITHSIASAGLVSSKEIRQSVKDRALKSGCVSRQIVSAQMAVSIFALGYLGWNWQAVAAVVWLVLSTSIVEGE